MKTLALHHKTMSAFSLTPNITRFWHRVLDYLNVEKSKLLLHEEHQVLAFFGKLFFLSIQFLRRRENNEWKYPTSMSTSSFVCLFLISTRHGSLYFLICKLFTWTFLLGKGIFLDIKSAFFNRRWKEAVSRNLPIRRVLPEVSVLKEFVVIPYCKYLLYTYFLIFQKNDNSLEEPSSGSANCVIILYLLSNA